jgi:hypothetical protein
MSRNIFGTLFPLTLGFIQREKYASYIPSQYEKHKSINNCCVNKYVEIYY